MLFEFPKSTPLLAVGARPNCIRRGRAAERPGTGAVCYQDIGTAPPVHSLANFRVVCMVEKNGKGFAGGKPDRGVNARKLRWIPSGSISAFSIGKTSALAHRREGSVPGLAEAS